MEHLPEIVKAMRDFSGSISVEFKSEVPGKENEKRNFQQIRGGLSWPTRDLPAYICILGQYSGTITAAPGSVRLLFERQCKTSPELLLLAANMAKDLRFSEYFTDLSKPEWQGFHEKFRQYIQHNRKFREIRLKHSDYADDFLYGMDVIRRWANNKVLELPGGSIVRDQLRSLNDEDLRAESPELKFDAINALRYVAIPFDKVKIISPFNRQAEAGNSSLAWT